VGYELYVRMLEESVARLKGEAPAEGPEPELNLSVAAGLPEAYVPDPQVRLSLYKRLSLAKSAAEVSAVEAELDDRFGPPPEPARHLLLAVELKALLRRMMGTRLDVSAEALTVHFGHEPRVDLDRLMGLARDKPDEVKVYPDGRVAVRLDGGGQPLARAREFLSYISGEAG
jgi:transcription-repair coupling factor (superfamily II helicase)